MKVKISRKTFYSAWVLSLGTVLMASALFAMEPGAMKMDNMADEKMMMKEEMTADEMDKKGDEMMAQGKEMKKKAAMMKKEMKKGETMKEGKMDQMDGMKK
ncbi:MAG TPA: hypothetical protein VI382_00030 [Candidatus Manganitrophaceae bacterium]|nr:hypothetical protein [Candidatus Manganitrophaceae bacterium]